MASRSRTLTLPDEIQRRMREHLVEQVGSAKRRAFRRYQSASEPVRRAYQLGRYDAHREDRDLIESILIGGGTA